jgi:hypothetical protein
MAETADKKVVGKAFKVEINGRFLPIKSYTGGELVIEEADTKHGTSPQGESTPGHNYVTELTLQAYITPTQKVLAEAADQVAHLKQQQRFIITITELAKDKSAVKTFVYENCLFTSLDYPRLSSQGGEILCETATFKPEFVKVE